LYTERNPKGGRAGTVSMTESGQEYLARNLYLIEYLIKDDFSYKDVQQSFVKLEQAISVGKEITILDENILIREGTQIARSSKSYERSKSLRDAAIKKNTQNGEIECYICSFNFHSFYGDLGKDYIEIHHKKPLFVYESDDVNLTLAEALTNVVPLCANCHRIIHRDKKMPLSVDFLKNEVVKNRLTG
jgi:predicted HNH restriction endonuclease